ncbi:MAG: T9SS C-terminal target domain-containing protein, partial [Methanobacteriota archaeon]
TRIASTPASQTSYTDSSVFPLQDYYYVVTLFNDTGESHYSNEALGRVNDSLLFFEFSTPQLSITPTIDGVLSPGEWDDAIVVDVSDVFGYFSGTPKPQGSAFLYFKFDDASDILYVAGEDFLNPSLDNNEGFGLYFDDDNDGDFEPDDALPMVTEGNFWAYWHPTGSDLRFRPIYENGAVGDIITIPDAQLDFSDASGHLTGEVAIPMGFLEGYQLQVYGPDKMVGLGAFVLARQGSTPIFNGWWPQTMNSIFNPLYFGDVGIDVTLLAPPKPPSNVQVTKQGNDLLVTWDDPTEGLNNDPLPVPPQIYLFRNGDSAGTFSPGVESFLDDSVLCGAWYEYQLQASITVDTLTLTGPESTPAGSFACQDPQLTAIRYDDGGAEAFFVVSFTYDDNKFAVRFTPTFYPTRVIRLETLVNSGAEFDYTIQSDFNGLPGPILAGPYRVHADDANPFGTVSFTLPGTDPPVLQSGDFWVVINYLPESPGAPGVGVDNSSPNAGRGKYYTRSGGWVDFTFGNLMVTAYITDPLVGVEEPLSPATPYTYELMPNFPNPFNPETNITFQVASEGKVTLTIYDVLGRKVRTLLNKSLIPGKYSVIWDGTNEENQPVPSGIYFYRLRATAKQKHGKEFIQTHKMVLLR